MTTTNDEFSHVLQIRLTASMRERLRRRAFQEDRPISVVARDLILDGLKRRLPAESA